jgi:plasmid stabilization system protein ParE
VGRNVLFLDEALDELDEAIRYYARAANLTIAERLAADAQAGVQRAAEAPERWPVERNGFRRERLKRFPYSWRYEVLESGEVRFVAFAHAKRRTDYFRGRVR